MNYSRQREMILNILSLSKSHPTAEEVLEEVKKQDEHVARGTVYRNLNLLVESGDIIKIVTPEGIFRYDYIHSPHSHAVCDECGKVFDFTFKDIGLDEFLKEKLGFSAGNSAISVRGTCDLCSKKL